MSFYHEQDMVSRSGSSRREAGPGWLEKGSDGPLEGTAWRASWGQACWGARGGGVPGTPLLPLPHPPSVPTYALSRSPTPEPGCSSPWPSWAARVLQSRKLCGPWARGSDDQAAIRRSSRPASTHSIPNTTSVRSFWALGAPAGQSRQGARPRLGPSGGRGPRGGKGNHSNCSGAKDRCPACRCKGLGIRRG